MLIEFRPLNIMTVRQKKNFQAQVERLNTTLALLLFFVVDVEVRVNGTTDELNGYYDELTEDISLDTQVRNMDLLTCKRDGKPIL